MFLKKWKHQFNLILPYFRPNCNQIKKAEELEDLAKMESLRKAETQLLKERDSVKQEPDPSPEVITLDGSDDDR